MKTIIYSCGKGMTSVELLESANEDVSTWFPEIRKHRGLCVALTENEQLDLLPLLTGETIVTVSEIIILMFLREIRLGRMQSDELELYCAGRQVDISLAGGLLDPWDGGFFEVGFHLRF